MTTPAAKAGIAAGGNWIVDRVKMVDRLPGRGMLGNIRSESQGTGGAAANVLIDLARMKAPFPLTGYGVIGRDADGEFVLKTAKEHGIDVAGIQKADGVPTSYTDVMCEEKTGDRSFFHCRGANALFAPASVPVASLSCRIFHLGYLLLLDGMDQPHAEHGTVAAAFLNSLQRRGIKTSVDVVSEESDRFNTLVPPALRHVDYLILNEIEVSRVAQMAVRGGAGDLDGSALRDAVERLHSFGRMQLVAVHMPEGVYVRDNAGKRFSQGALEVPDGFIRGKVGAGDAFCAGMLYGLHEGWPHARAARLGTCCATACISDPTASGGVVPVDEALDLARRFPEGKPPVCV